MERIWIALERKGERFVQMARRSYEAKELRDGLRLLKSKGFILALYEQLESLIKVTSYPRCVRGEEETPRGKGNLSSVPPFTALLKDSSQ